MAFIDLLLTASFIQLHELHAMFVLKICHGRIIESEVAILTDAQTAEIDRLSFQQRRVALAFIQRQESVSRNVVEGAWTNSLFDAFAHVTSKTRGMIGRDAEVF